MSEQNDTTCQREENLCRNNGDNLTMVDLLKRMRTLRSDSDYHGELLAMLRHPRNRDTIRGGKKEDLDQLFQLIDDYAEARAHRMASIH